MTLEEAEIIARICSQADGGCSNCVRELGCWLAKAFPDFLWSAQFYEKDKYPDLLKTATEKEQTYDNYDLPEPNSRGNGLHVKLRDK